MQIYIFFLKQWQVFKKKTRIGSLSQLCTASCTTSPAKVKPMMAVIWAIVPLIWALLLFQSWLARSARPGVCRLLSSSSLSVPKPSLAPRLGSTSGLQTHLNLCPGKRFCRRIRRRSAAANGQPSTSQNSLTLTCVGSIFSAAPIELKRVGRRRPSIAVANFLSLA